MDIRDARAIVAEHVDRYVSSKTPRVRLALTVSYPPRLDEKDTGALVVAPGMSRAEVRDLLRAIAEMLDGGETAVL